MKKILAVFTFMLSLQGCFVAAGAAAGAAAVAVVYDHRGIEKVVYDQRIANTAFDRLRTTPELRGKTHIDVTCFNQVVLMTGEATSPELRQKAEEVVQSIPDVKRIYNQITIQGPISSLTRTSDSWISTKIKTQMLASSDLKSSAIKVITENGAVYLMGIVTHDQANTAVDIARQVSGVQKVVKIFQYKD